MTKPSLRLVPLETAITTPDPGAPIAEVFAGNMPMKLAKCFDLVGGAWVMPQPREAGQDLSDCVGIVKTHDKGRLINRITGFETPLKP